MAILAVLWVGLYCGPARAQNEAGPLVAAERFTLDNGMRFVVVERPRAVTVSAGWLVEAGTAHDPPHRVGLAHVLEHLLFQGTGTIGPGELDRLYAEAGATGLNALTRRDFTAYFVALPLERLELWFWLESDRLLDARFRDFGPELGAILEERRLRVDATSTGPLLEAASVAFWGKHPYGRPNAGRPEDLAELSLDEVRSHFARHYHPGSLTAVLVGPIRAAEIRPLAELYFGRLEGAEGEPPQGEPVTPTWPVGQLESGAPASTPSSTTVGTQAAAVLGGEGSDGERATTPGREPLVASCDCRPQVRVSYPAPPFAHPDSATAEVLVALLSGRSGRLHRSLVLKGERAFAAYPRHTRLRRGGRLTLIAEARTDRRELSLVELESALRHQMGRLATEPVPRDELARARNRLRADTYRRLEASSELLLELLFHHGLGAGDHLDAWESEIASVTPERVRQLAAALVGSGRELAVRLSRRDATEGTGGR